MKNKVGETKTPNVSAFGSLDKVKTLQETWFVPVFLIRTNPLMVFPSRFTYKDLSRQAVDVDEELPILINVMGVDSSVAK
jgi:hypothetical protein